MSDIRKRTGAKGTTYQVRYADQTSRSGYSYATFGTMKEAKAYSHDSRGWKTSSSPDDMTIPEAVDYWLVVCEKEGRNGRSPVSFATLRYYRYIAEIMTAYTWTKTVSALATPDVVDFRSWLLKSYSRELASKVLIYFHGVLGELVTRGRLVNNVASGVGVQTATRYTSSVLIPSREEVLALLMASDQLANSKNAQIAKSWERYRPMLYLAIDSGMRPQEYLAIGGAHVTEAGVRVERALERGAGLSVPKTQAARRFIDEISPDTLAMVIHYRDHKAEKNKHDLVFPTATGECQSPDNWRKRGFFAASEKAGLVEVTQGDNGEEIVSPKYTPYALRHFYASVLIAERLNLKKIQTLMGHRSIETTFDVYGHLLERVENESKAPVGILSRIESGTRPNTSHHSL